MAAGTQDKRLDVRLSAEHKQIIEQAAGLLGQTVSAFTVSTLVQQAVQVVERFGVLRLTDRDRDLFLAALDKPPEPNARLRGAARSHAEKVRR
jgi:uncharacterized protein (DUF1778 family)